MINLKFPGGVVATLAELKAIKADQDRQAETLSQMRNYLASLGLPMKGHRQRAMGRTLRMPPGMPNWHASEIINVATSRSRDAWPTHSTLTGFWLASWPA